MALGFRPRPGLALMLSRVDYIGISSWSNRCRTEAQTFAANPVPVLRLADGGMGDAVPITDGAFLTFGCGVEGAGAAEGMEGVMARGRGVAVAGLAFALKAIGASSLCGGVAKAGFRNALITLRDTSMTKSPPSAISAIMLGQSRRSKLKAAKELITRRRLSCNHPTSARDHSEMGIGAQLPRD